MTTQELIAAAKALLEVANDAIADHKDDCAREPDERHDLYDPECEVNAKMLAKVCEFALSACEGEIDYKAEYERAKREASDLATWLWKKHYQQDAPNWGLCDTAAGILTQIDNMVCTLVKTDPAACEGEKAGETKADEPGLNWKLSDEASDEIERMQRANTIACAKAGDFIMRSTDRAPKE